MHGAVDHVARDAVPLREILPDLGVQRLVI